MAYDMILSPEQTLLDLRFAVLRNRLVDTLTERNMLVHQRIPYEKARYTHEFGDEELQLAILDYQAARASARVCLAQALKNQDKPIDAVTLADQLDVAFHDKQAAIQQASDLVTWATDHLENTTPLSPEDSEKLHTDFKTLVKALHPDLHPDQSPRDANMFALAQVALADGDLELMATLVETLAVAGSGTDPAPSTEPATMTATGEDPFRFAKRDLFYLAHRYLHEKAQTLALYEEWPLNVAGLLGVPRWLARQHGHYEQLLQQWSWQVAADNVRYGVLIGDLGGINDKQ
ncbi:hypothetical protein [Lacticaseibacillus mingshuiensis]|uniref:J domain-containing protein n=1 Tax=Lacticaseibacillus mingshuiensis TaxID=2799574 RepID=A0ABW4CHX7_9LACO|nr:hypothetical protein [Lacticaseibacillus mingshuiensis]